MTARSNYLMGRNMALMRQANNGEHVQGAYVYVRRAMYEEDGEKILHDLKDSLEPRDYRDAVAEHQALLSSLG